MGRGLDFPPHFRQRRLVDPNGLAIVSQENVYVADSQNGRIVIYSYVP